LYKRGRIRARRYGAASYSSAAGYFFSPPAREVCLNASAVTRLQAPPP